MWASRSNVPWRTLDALASHSLALLAACIVNAKAKPDAVFTNCESIQPANVLAPRFQSSDKEQFLTFVCKSIRYITCCDAVRIDRLMRLRKASPHWTAEAAPAVV